MSYRRERPSTLTVIVADVSFDRQVVAVVVGIEAVHVVVWGGGERQKRVSANKRYTIVVVEVEAVRVVVCGGGPDTQKGYQPIKGLSLSSRRSKSYTWWSEEGEEDAKKKNSKGISE